MPLGTNVDLSAGYIVLDGDLVPLRMGHSSHDPSFWATVYCGYGRPSHLLLSSCNYCLDLVLALSLKERSGDTVVSYILGPYG